MTGETDTPLTDPAFLAFLRERLAEEVVAARERGDEVPDRPGDRSGDPVDGRGLSMLHELLWAMEHGQAPDKMSLGLLTVAYASHPGFDPAWNRWLVG